MERVDRQNPSAPARRPAASVLQEPLEILGRATDGTCKSSSRRRSRVGWHTKSIAASHRRLGFTSSLIFSEMAVLRMFASSRQAAYRLSTSRPFAQFNVLTLSVPCPRIIRAAQFPSNGISTTTDVRSTSSFENHEQVSVEELQHR